jgi:hypothetical protein
VRISVLADVVVIAAPDRVALVVLHTLMESRRCSKPRVRLFGRPKQCVQLHCGYPMRFETHIALSSWP